MITLIDIANRLNNKKALKFDGRQYNWRPETIDDYTVPEFKITESNAKGANAKLKNKLSKVLAFIDEIKFIRAMKGCTIMPISVTSKSNLLIWGSKANVSNAIKLMEQIGLISLESNFYRFNAYTEIENVSKTYRYYYENELKIKDYCSKNNIETYQVKNMPCFKDARKEIPELDKTKVRFAAGLKLVKPSGVSKAEFEKEVMLCLFENYPPLQFHMLKADEINERFYRNYPEFRIRFSPKFTWNKDDTYIKKIGIRATNSMDNIKKEDRKKILQSYGFTLEKDINASVPRLTLSLNSGKWIPETEDIYELIFRDMEPEKEFTNEMREAIKKLFMRAYFDISDKQVIHHIWEKMDQDNLIKEDIAPTITKFRNSVIKVLGGKLYGGSEIFYIESCVYLMTLYDLLTSHHKVWQVYDCFYSTGEEDQELFVELISNGVRINFNEFIKVWPKIL